jgi:hypothetical protein
MNYLLSKKDFCPFIGGLAGFHWILKENGHFSSPELELGARTGVIALRTYSFHIVVNFEYNFTVSDEPNQAFIFTLGIASDYIK